MTAVRQRSIRHLAALPETRLSEGDAIVSGAVRQI
jgi:hypothetical protein